MFTIRHSAVCGIALVAMFATSACAGDGTVATQAVSSPSSSSTTAGVMPLGDASLTEKTQRPEAPSQLVVTHVRTGAHDHFDRVVFDLAGSGQPGWYVDYVDSPSQQASGSAVPVKGKAFLNVNIDGVVPAKELGIPDPQLRTIAGTGCVVEVVKASNGGGRAQFIIGVDKEHPYSVEMLENPLRLVVDIHAK
ncbi:AMIN-like domain-containing (lipo)protein [Corynebacterium lubricantis]|uniref:AMIN-like domain-containing (lipo)protein n=1 Tax=Corynebacterium lubricantis TaxID=541095 RepID=UPI0012EAB48C|nr:hypothetical protein [Corynebacterium lubricantis]